MSALGLVKAGPLLPGSLIAPLTELQFHVQDTLASARRLWVRGRLLGAVDPTEGAARQPHWWEQWRGKAREVAPPVTVHLETQVSGQVLQADAPLAPDGQFEALLAADLPPARRGWRIARNRVVCAGQAAEACSVVLTPPAEAAGAVVVCLPHRFTWAASGPQMLERSELAARWSPVLRRLRQAGRAGNPFYYLASVPPDGDNRQVELALATTALAWPPGHFVLLPAGAEAANAALARGLDRLRWLFAGALDLLVINLEPAATRLLPSAVELAKDRAVVRRLVHPEDDPCSLFDDPPPEIPRPCLAAPRPTRASLITRSPIVFCHGMLAFTMLRMQMPEDVNCFSPLANFLRERGIRALFPQLAPTSGVVERAKQLREQILRWTDEPINLIAHSMGGLDARYLITHLGMAQRVRSVTMVSTPHRGTFLADWFLVNYRNRVPLLLALEAMGVNVDGFRDCRRSACRDFNASTPDMPGVRYFSFGGDVPHARVAPVLRRAWNLLTSTEGPNDGMVSVASARWGEYLGTVAADHYAQTPDGTFIRPGEDFDALGFYLRLVENLARRGF